MRTRLGANYGAVCAILCFACSSQTSTEGTAGVPPGAAGLAPLGTTAPVSGKAAPPGGVAPAGAPAPDAGMPVPDAGPPAPDAGTQATDDAGAPATEDAGTPATDDAGPTEPAPETGYYYCLDSSSCSPEGSVCLSDGSICGEGDAPVFSSGFCNDTTPCTPVGVTCPSDGSTCGSGSQAAAQPGICKSGSQCGPLGSMCSDGSTCACPDAAGSDGETWPNEPALNCTLGTDYQDTNGCSVPSPTYDQAICNTWSPETPPLSPSVAADVVRAKPQVNYPVNGTDSQAVRFLKRTANYMQLSGRVTKLGFGGSYAAVFTASSNTLRVTVTRGSVPPVIITASPDATLAAVVDFSCSGGNLGGDCGISASNPNPFGDDIVLFRLPTTTTGVGTAQSSNADGTFSLTGVRSSLNNENVYQGVCWNTSGQGYLGKENLTFTITPSP